MMKIKFLMHYSGKQAAYKPGDVAELDDAEAADLLCDSVAERHNDGGEEFAPVPYVGVIDTSDGVDAAEAALAGKALSEFKPETQQPESAAPAATVTRKAKNASQNPKAKRHN